MTKAELKKDIKDKFGSVANFCRATNFHYKEIANFFNRPDSKAQAIQDKIFMLAKLCAKTDRSKIEDRYINPEDRANIYLKIIQDAGDVLAFTNKHPQWPYEFVYNIIGNNNRIKLKNDRVKRFMSFLDSL